MKEISEKPGKSRFALIFATSRASGEMSERVRVQSAARFMLSPMHPLPQQMSRTSAFSTFFSSEAASSTINSVSGRGIRTRSSTKNVSSKNSFSLVM